MDVRCERCRAQYVFDDEQFTPSGLTVRCTNCGHLFRVRKKEIVVTVPLRPDELSGAPLTPGTVAANAPRARPLAVVAEEGADADLGAEVERSEAGRELGHVSDARRLAVGALVAAALFATGAAVYRFGPTLSAARRGPAPVEAAIRLETPDAPPPRPAAAATAPAARAEPAAEPPSAPPAAPSDAAGPGAPAPGVAAAVPAPAAGAAPPAAEPVAAPTPPKPAGPKALLAEADRLRARGHTERALDLYGRLVSDDPANVAALAGRGLCYLDLERWAPAEASFQAALEHDPENGDALLGLAETYRWQGRRADAIKYYRSYLAAHPGGEDAAAARNAVTELEE